jgi:hypothetical protein
MADSAQAAYAEAVALRIAPRLRAAGFRGPAGDWNLTASNGDVAIVNLQKSRWNTGDKVGFAVNLAIVPVPWFEWVRKQYGLSSTAKPREYHGLWRDRLRPADGLSGDGQFWVVRDERSAAACAEDELRNWRGQAYLACFICLIDRHSWWRSKPEISVTSKCRR